ncbi:ATP-dependent DNA helicase [Symbiobacterium thermophilum]|uniref:ATP-dependent DNA helicase n=1 Tax=Symbiobacterium thermophilum TaxID=2734 RepID=UPI0035C6648A
MQIRWTKLPFTAHNESEYRQGLNDWLGRVFYDVLPEHGFEVREEQIYTAFRIARALTEGSTLLAEAGPGTGKTFAYLLPAVCHARMRGRPVVVASASSVLKAQLTGPDGDIQTLSRLLNLDIDVRVAGNPADYVCEMKVEAGDFGSGEEPEGWSELIHWARRTGTGARSEVPGVPDDLWELVSWDPSLNCDTCPRRGHCLMVAARRQHRAAADLVVCDHRLFAQDLLTRNDLLEGGMLPILPSYSAVIFDEGHHFPETWQRAQGWSLSQRRLRRTLERLEYWHAREQVAWRLEAALVAADSFMQALDVHTRPGEGKRDVDRSELLLKAAARLDQALDLLQTELVTEEAMSEGQSSETELQAYQNRIDELRAALRLFRRPESVVWREGDELWVVPRRPKPLFGGDLLKPGTPVVFSSATLEPDYQARVLGLSRFDQSRVGVPFDLGRQSLVYLPPDEGSGMDAAGPDAAVDAVVDEAVRVLHATGGRALILVRSLAEVRRWRQALAAHHLPWPVIYEGDGDRGAQLERFRAEVDSVLVGAGFWEGVDVRGEALSCVILPYLPFPEHDPLIRERRGQAQAAGQDPFRAVDLPEMLIKLKQGMGRLIRTAEDRGVIALLDRSYRGADWAGAVEEAFPEGARRVTDLAEVKAFLAGTGRG